MNTITKLKSLLEHLCTTGDLETKDREIIRQVKDSESYKRLPKTYVESQLPSLYLIRCTIDALDALSLNKDNSRQEALKILEPVLNLPSFADLFNGKVYQTGVLLANGENEDLKTRFSQRLKSYQEDFAAVPLLENLFPLPSGDFFEELGFEKVETSKPVRSYDPDRPYIPWHLENIPITPTLQEVVEKVKDILFPPLVAGPSSIPIARGESDLIPITLIKQQAEPIIEYLEAQLSIDRLVLPTSEMTLQLIIYPQEQGDSLLKQLRGKFVSLRLTDNEEKEISFDSEQIKEQSGRGARLELQLEPPEVWLELEGLVDQNAFKQQLKDIILVYES